MSQPENQVWAWHIHHRTLYERTSGTVGLAERSDYIKKEKPWRERARRLRLLKLVKNQEVLSALAQALREVGPVYLRPVKEQSAVRALRASIQKAIGRLHALECPRCPWNGRTIFPKRKR